MFTPATVSTSLLGQEASRLWIRIAAEVERKSRNDGYRRDQRDESCVMASRSQNSFLSPNLPSWLPYHCVTAVNMMRAPEANGARSGRGRGRKRRADHEQSAGCRRSGLAADESTSASSYNTVSVLSSSRQHTVDRDGSRSGPQSSVDVEATAAKPVETVIGMLFFLIYDRIFKARVHLGRIMMRSPLTQSVLYRAQRGFRKILREHIVRVRSGSDIHAVATASAATRASRPR